MRDGLCISQRCVYRYVSLRARGAGVRRENEHSRAAEERCGEEQGKEEAASIRNDFDIVIRIVRPVEKKRGIAYISIPQKCLRGPEERRMEFVCEF